jgi:hypothetical protein
VKAENLKEIGVERGADWPGGHGSRLISQPKASNLSNVPKTNKHLTGLS